MPVDANGTAYDFLPAQSNNGSGRANAPTIVLIHGMGLCRHLWDAHIPALNQNYQILNYDFYGQGDSQSPKSTPSLSVYAGQILDLIDGLKIDKVHLVGFSIGGMINRRFALNYPDRLSSIVILNSPHERSLEAQAAIEERTAVVANEGSMATMDAALARWFTPEFLANHKDKTDLVKDWRATIESGLYAEAYSVLATGVTELIRPEKPIAIPSFVLTCENDSGSTPAMSYAIADEIVGEVETLILPKLKHLGLMEDPKAYTDAILGFLDKIQPQ